MSAPNKAGRTPSNTPKHCTPLHNCVRDAKAIAKTLTEKLPCKRPTALSRRTLAISPFRFNSNLVRLKASSQVLSFVCTNCFNSNLVRLKVHPSGKQFIHSTSFNSNLVRLKGFKSYYCQQKNESFNSNLVRLKVTLLRCSAQFILWFQFQSGTIKRFLKTL